MLAYRTEPVISPMPRTGTGEIFTLSAAKPLYQMLAHSFLRLGCVQTQGGRS